MFNVSKTDSNSEINLMLGAMPYFLTRDKKAVCELNIRIFARKKDSFHEEEIDYEKKITFKLKENQTFDENIELEIMERLGAYHTEGVGYSVHPKQLYTDIALREQIESTSPNDIEIAYIGTDTFENLLSMIRRFKREDFYRTKLRKLTIYYTEAWDEKIMRKYPNLRLDPKISDGHFNVEFRKLPKNGNKLQWVKPVDYVLATYVTPWAMDENNKSQYSSLIHDLLNKNNSFLISVDPENSSKVIRSHSEHFNLQELYVDELNLKNVNASDTNESMVVNWNVWKLRRVDQGG